MQKLKYSGSFSNDQSSIKVIVGLFQFEEEGNTIIYSPAFDVSGYGKNSQEAKHSFEETMDEFLDYTFKKKTLIKELNRLGWKLKPSDVVGKKIKSPELADLITKNDYPSEILNEKQFKKFDREITVPAF